MGEQRNLTKKNVEESEAQHKWNAYMREYKNLYFDMRNGDLSDYLDAKFKGGITPEISKSLGWDERRL